MIVRLPVALAVAFIVATTVGAQEAPAEPDEPPEDDAFFEDPFAVDEPDDDDAFFTDPFSTDAEAGAEPEGASGVERGPGDGEPGATGPEATDDLFAIDDFDSLFADEEMIDIADEAAVASAPEDDLLTSEGVRWGGSVGGSASADWNWEDVWTSDFAFFDPSSNSLSPSLNGDLFFDARPDATFRVYGELTFSTTTSGDFDLLGLTGGAIDTGILPEGWTVETGEDGSTEIRDENGILIVSLGGTDDAEGSGEDSEPEPTTGTAPGIELGVFELFTDFTWNDALFFRFGKHTIQWGAGYFFSPADVLNLTAVDAEDPTASREGPISLRVIYPFGVTGNAYLYAITNAGAGVLDVALAPRVEFVAGPGELGLGAFYQRVLAPRLVGIYTASVGEVDLFTEGVLLIGSDRTFVRPSRDQSAADADPDDGLETVLDTYTVDRALFAQATFGARYLTTFENDATLVMVGEYFFNGDGYPAEESDLLPAAARLLLNPGENGLAIENPDAQPAGYEPPPDLAPGDLVNWGRHYLGATLSVGGFLLDELSFALFGLVNLADLSGIVSPSLSFGVLDRFSLSASARLTFGGERDEFTDPEALFTGDDAAPTFGLTLSVRMPGGSF